MTPTTPDTPALSAFADNGAPLPDGAAWKPRRTWPQSVPFYYGWVNVVMASIAMTATLPSRTHGLGLITDPLTRSIGISETYFASLNLLATILGAAFSLPVGFFIDRYGVRVVLTVVSLLFGTVVLAMASVTTPLMLLITLTLVRGFGQSALSIVATSIVGKWFGRRMGLAMGVYALLLSIGFMGSIYGFNQVSAVVQWKLDWLANGLTVPGWRAGLYGCGVFLLAFLAPVGWLLVRSTPEACGVIPDERPAQPDIEPTTVVDYTYQQALATPIFWVIAIGASMFNFVWSSITLFNHKVLTEQGFSPSLADNALVFLVPGGLLANAICGAVTHRGNVAKVLGISMAMLCICLILFPSMTSDTQLIVYMLTLGVIGGMVTVAHFAAWRALFGASHLGRVQGPAQLLSVLFSAVGPLYASYCRDVTKSYDFGFYTMALMVGMLGVAAFLVPTPPQRHTETSS